LRAQQELNAKELWGALSGLAPHARPSVVHVVEEIPVTTWYRPITVPLREAGVPEPSDEHPAWFLDASGRSYRPLTQTARRRLTKRAA
jgi:putative long chain acyl-CoA synthase